MSDDRKTIEPFVGPLPDQEEPLDVKITGRVHVRNDEPLRFGTGAATFSNGQETVMILPADRKRRSAVIVNPSLTDTVTLLADRQGAASNGFPLAPGASLAVAHQAPVFGICPTASGANQVTVNYALEASTE